MTEVKVENGLYYQSFIGEADLNNVAELDERIRRSREQPPETETRREAYRRAGLTALVHEIEPSPDEVERLEAERPLRMLGLAPMTDEELRTWHTWLPTCYSSSPRTAMRSLDHERQISRLRRDWLDMPRDLYRRELVMNQLTSYNYSDVPLEVAEKMDTLGDKFDYLYILTPEGRYKDARRLQISLDPVLVGVRNEQHWLLARWGEVDPNVVSYEKLHAALLLEKWTRGRYNRRISVRQELLPLTLLSLLVGVGTGIVGMLVAVLMHEALGWITKEQGLWIVAGAFTLGVAGFHLAAWRKNLARAAGRLIARWRYPGVEKLL